MKEELRLILKELNELLNETGLKITDAELIDFSLRIYNTNQINKKTFLKNELSPKERLLESNEIPATQNQIYALKKAGKTIPNNLSKKEAFNLIREIKKKNE